MSAESRRATSLTSAPREDSGFHSIPSGHVGRVLFKLRHAALNFRALGKRHGDVFLMRQHLIPQFGSKLELHRGRPLSHLWKLFENHVGTLTKKRRSSKRNSALADYNRAKGTDEGLIIPATGQL